MGTRCALNYAILFMAVLGDKFLAQQSTKPMAWKRYINDIFMIWDHTETELDHFLDKLNNYHPTIKFTKKTGLSEIPFLDVLVKKDPKTFTLKHQSI